MTDQGAKRDTRRGGAVRSVIIFTLILGLLASISIGVGGYFAYREAARPGPLEEPQAVLLISGSSVSRIAAELEASGVIRNSQLFTAAVRVKGVQSDIKAGEYEIPARASVLEVIDLLVSGKGILHSFTAPEGRTTAQILKLVESHPVLYGEITLTPAEGALLPETYHFTRGETRDGMIRTMTKAQDELLDALWDDRALDLPFNTRAEALTLASIVEKETGLPEERARVAAVFVNRLKRGMRLESDPTIIYGLTKGEPLGRGLRLSELRGETPYNTYVINGLPPTPIANPGRGAIEAVLHPMETDEIFFVADGTGGHLFATTLAEHNRNVAKWRSVERARRANN
ncbi:MAG: endolytic transglycosylase MltG [Amphiplicatus sp.]